MKYNSIGEQLIAKAQELDPNYKPDKFNDMSEALDVILNNTGGEGGDIWLDIAPYLSEGENEGTMSISQEGYDLVHNAFDRIGVENPINKYIGIIIQGNKFIFNRFIDSDISDKKGIDFILNITIDGVKAYMKISIYNNKSIEVKEELDSSNKVWYELPNLLLLENITQEQFNEIKNLALQNQLAGVNCGGLYCPLTFYQDGENMAFFYPWYENDIFTAYLIRLDTDLSVKKIPYSTITLPQTAPTSQVIPSITTSNTQQNLTVGDGLTVENGVLKIKEVESTEFVCANYGFQMKGISEVNAGVDVGKGIITTNTDVINKATQFINLFSSKESFSKHKCSISIEIDSLGLYTEVANLYPVKSGNKIELYATIYLFGNAYADIFIDSLNNFHIQFIYIEPTESKLTQLGQIMTALATSGKITFNILKL